MAKTQAEAEAPAKKDDEDELFPIIETGMENGLRWQTVNILGTVYRFREISVPESDAAIDASRNPDGTFNTRLQTRMELVASIVSPTTTIADIDTWGVRKFRAMMYVSDRINTLSPADTAGNA